MKVALAYDRVNKWGGAESVLLALHKLFPDAPLYTSVYNPKTASWAEEFDPSAPFDKAQGKGSGQGIRTSFLQKFPFASSAHELYASLMPIAFESFSFDQYDLVISVTSEAAKGIITKPKTLHICYCLTPTRYLWSGYNDYFSNPILRFVSKPLVAYLKTWDKRALKPLILEQIPIIESKTKNKAFKRDANDLIKEIKPDFITTCSKDGSLPGIL